MDTTVSIDWLSYTIRNNQMLDTLQSYPSTWPSVARNVTGLDGDWLEGRGMHGYGVSMKSIQPEGALVLMCAPMPDMGVHVQLSGRLFSERDASERLRYALYAGGRCSRIDLALDVKTKLDFGAFYLAAKDGLLNTKSRRAAIIESTGGTTVYIGSRQSEQYLRIYDKGAEAGLDHDQTRIELEVKGSRAHAVAQYLSATGLESIPGIIRAFCDWPGEEKWEKIFATLPKVKVGRPRKEKDRDRWLNDQVLPALREDFEVSRKGTLVWLSNVLTMADAMGLAIWKSGEVWNVDDLPF